MRPRCVKCLVAARISPLFSGMKLFQGAAEYRASTLVLVLANLVPLIGVFALGWSAFNVVALYWMENLIIGLITILKMLTCSPDAGEIKEKVEGLKKKALAKAGAGSGAAGKSRALSSGGTGDREERQRHYTEKQINQLEQMSGKEGCANHGSKLFFVPFFTVHYGMFCAGHGFFVLMLLGGDKPMEGPAGGVGAGDGPLAGGLALVSKVLEGGGFWFVLVLLASHLFSYFVNFIGKGEYRKTVVPELMFAPYPRIMVLHVAILLGAFAILAVGSSVGFVALLVFGKIAIDLRLHLRSHRKLEAKADNDEVKDPAENPSAL